MRGALGPAIMFRCVACVNSYANHPGRLLLCNKMIIVIHSVFNLVAD